MGGVELAAWAFLAGLVWLAGYVVAGLIWPFAACRKCEGAGRFRSPSRKAWRLCRRCKGSGTRVRIGRRLWTWLSDAKNDAVG